MFREAMDAGCDRPAAAGGFAAAASAVCRQLYFLILIAVILGSAASAMAQERGERGDRRRGGSAEDQARELMGVAERMDWDSEAPWVVQAHQNVFRRYGWTSEEDNFALDLVNQVTRIPPWETQAREEVFANAIQTRYGLSHDQTTLMVDEMRREGMKVAFKHWRTLLPMAAEVVQTRIKQEPFTAEQIQRWSQKVEPIMEDALGAFERTTAALEATMTPEQKQKLRKDVDAVVRRHRDVEKMVKKWKTGQWDPRDWGLENDPLHLAAMNALPTEPAAPVTMPNERAIAARESEWDKYVQWFCDHYGCSERQRTSAASILAQSKKEAVAYRAARKSQFDRAERLRGDGSDAALAKQATEQLDRLNAPVAAMFERLKMRLFRDVLTSKQRPIGATTQSADRPTSNTP